MIVSSILKSMIAVPAVFLLAMAARKDISPGPPVTPVQDKEAYIPAKVWRVPEHNNYDSDTSEFCHSRKVESENIVIFWAKEFGADPMKNPDSLKRFNVNEALKECERFYDYYVNDLKIVQKGRSVTDKYKVLFYVIGGKEQTAFGGGEENKVGILWTPAVRMRRAPYGALAHELGHAFQYLASSDNGTGPRGAIMEMSAQYMLWQVYPEWMTFENYHLVSLMKKTHFAFLHPTNMYHTPYVIEYWSNKHGIEFFGKLMRETKKGEDVVATYKRINGLSQQQFNDGMFDASRRFITWDMKRIEKVAAQYANQHATTFLPVGDGWLKIAESNCPQNYGYNGIRLTVPKKGRKVSLSFKGIAGSEGFRSVKIEQAGWRYGFLAVKKDGTREYGKMYSSADATVSFKVPTDTEYLWLVVMGAPKEHTEVSGKDENNAQWPYQIKLQGTGLY
ncbi:DUF6055 domain-containing protein [Terrimonas sp. NA20]|uniref:DUF6055 domain-containing protein n=1 Tax=Terrimonas ginsenosidimutans TaxID=2908004 RepID=A0ABS9KMD0_9BACT|nr:DUF6055 domain-containing protein [Terrimonas ginsenosidimutans]MCG2613483.1 DUF6055 domain-containing protein [Terrimonas ginsenosidimutans]